ncbi:MAG: TrbG/VirB9 family P-type conjugative transfer protein [Acidobacteriota bacterium]
MRRTALVLVSALLIVPAAFADGAPSPAPPNSQQLIKDLIQDASRPAPEIPEAPVVAIAPATAPVTRTPDEIQGAALLRAGQKPPIIAKSNVVRYPFGESQPIVECEPLRACDIELQAGESILGVAIGDSERWTASPLNSGEPTNLTPHVIVKPKDFGIATNLIVSTTRRTYHLGLNSPPKDQASISPYSHAVGFYFPGDMVQQWTSNEELQALATSRRAAAASVSFSSADPSTFHYDYKLATKGHVSWLPTLILDDGAHTYIKFPPAIRSSDAPVLMAQVNDSTAALNYRTSPDGLWYVADGLYDRLQLVVGSGRRQTTVDISRESH